MNTEHTDDGDAPKPQDRDTAWFSQLDVSAREAAQLILDELDQALARMLKNRAQENREPKAAPFSHN